MASKRSRTGREREGSGRWTSRLPVPVTADAGLEGYAVWTPDRDESIGTVAALLRRGGEEVVAVEQGAPPLRSSLRAVPLRAVAEIDHAALAVRLEVGSDQVARAPALDPAVAAGAKTDGVERVEGLPAGHEPAPAPPESGPIDSARLLAAIGLVLVAALVALGIVAALSVRGHSSWVWAVLAAPVLLALAGGGLAYRAWRHPYRPEGARRIGPPGRS